MHAVTAKNGISNARTVKKAFTGCEHSNVGIDELRSLLSIPEMPLDATNRSTLSLEGVAWGVEGEHANPVQMRRESVVAASPAQLAIKGQSSVAMPMLRDPSGPSKERMDRLQAQQHPLAIILIRFRTTTLQDMRNHRRPPLASPYLRGQGTMDLIPLW